MGLRLHHRNRLLVAALACVLVGALATGAGATRKTPAAKKPPVVNVQQNLATLYAAAKKEGKVVWQVATTPANYAPLVQAFQAQYPGISVQLINVSGPELAGRLITESEAGKLSWDLSTGRPDTTGPVIARKLMAAPRWTLYGVPQSKLSLGGRLIHTYDFVVAPVYNTHMYTVSQLPKTWSDLLKPQWANGKFIVDGQPTEGWESLLLGKNPFTLRNYANFVVAIAKQKPLVLSTSANVLNGVASGQAGLGLAAISNVPLMIQQGAPIGIDPISPVLALPSGVFVPTGAAHPNAARLLGAFLGSAAAEPLWAKGGWTPAAQPELGGIAKLLSDSGVKNFAYIDTKDELAKVLAGFAIDQQDLHLQ